MSDGKEAANHEKEVGGIAAEAKALARIQSHPNPEVLTGHIVVDPRAEGRARKNAHVHERKTVDNAEEQVKYGVYVHVFVHDIVHDFLFVLVVEHK